VYSFQFFIGGIARRDRIGEQAAPLEAVSDRGDAVGAFGMRYAAQMRGVEWIGDEPQPCLE
jgi:hypothetical protein